MRGVREYGTIYLTQPELRKEVYILSEKMENLLREYRKEVEHAAGAKLVKVVLYGSYARGDFRPDSDIDIMILLNEDAAGIGPIERKIFDATYDFNDSHDSDIKPVVQSNEHFNYWKKADMFYRNVDEDGVEI